MDTFTGTCTFDRHFHSRSTLRENERKMVLGVGERERLYWPDYNATFVPRRIESRRIGSITRYVYL